MLRRLPLLLASASFLAGATGILALGKPVPGYLLVPLEEVAPFHPSPDQAALESATRLLPPSVIFPEPAGEAGVSAASLGDTRPIAPPLFTRTLPAAATPAAVPVSMPVPEPPAAPTEPVIIPDLAMGGKGSVGTVPTPNPAVIAASAARPATVTPLVRTLEAEAPKESPTPNPTPSPVHTPVATPVPAPRVVTSTARNQSEEHDRHDNGQEGHGGPKKVTVQSGGRDRSRGHDD